MVCQHNEVATNVAEVIPYASFKEKINIVKEELLKNRHVEVWDDFIYSAEKRRGKNEDETGPRRNSCFGDGTGTIRDD